MGQRSASLQEMQLKKRGKIDMQNTILFNFKKGTVDLVNRLNTGTNELHIRVADGYGARIYTQSETITVTSGDFDYKFDDSTWTGTGIYAFTVFDNVNSYDFQIERTENEGDVCISKISEFRYELRSMEVTKIGSYNDLSDKPRINGITLQGNKSAYDIGVMPADADHVTHSELDAGLETKQDKLIAGQGITIDDNVISATDVEANPEGEPTATLSTIRIGSIIYALAGGSPTISTNANISVVQGATSVGQQGEVIT